MCISVYDVRSEDLRNNYMNELRKLIPERALYGDFRLSNVASYMLHVNPIYVILVRLLLQLPKTPKVRIVYNEILDHFSRPLVLYNFHASMS